MEENGRMLLAAVMTAGLLMDAVRRAAGGPGRDESGSGRG